MAVPEETIAQLAELSAVVLAQDDLTSTLTEICRIASRAVPGAEGASITTLREGRPVAIASDDWAREFDEMQYAEHEGPCFDAFRTGNVFRIRDLRNEQRWPSWVPQAVEHGAVSVVSLPMTAEGSAIGALNLYGRKPDAFTSEAVSVAGILAGHAGLASQVAASLFRHRDLAEQMTEAMRSRAVIEQAKGILMASRRCDADEAFGILVNLSQTSNRKLRVVAQALVDEAGK
ncbi:MAG TPA: GAF and ANTAR domain-containing protein [Mycobacteriales bacterium]|nr:GAF and ANTAR domain-containing protein [Mycobacteriales bacterium]